MLENRTYKFPICSTKELETLITETNGCSCFLFNPLLGQWNDTYKETGKGQVMDSLIILGGV